jgi:hypothetical protein
MSVGAADARGNAEACRPPAPMAVSARLRSAPALIPTRQRAQVMAGASDAARCAIPCSLRPVARIHLIPVPCPLPSTPFLPPARKARSQSSTAGAFQLW